MEEWIEFTGLSFVNCHIDSQYLPLRCITDDMLYHMFASGVFDVIRVKREFDRAYTSYDRAAMQNWVQQKDRLEIRRLKAELEDERARKASR